MVFDYPHLCARVEKGASNYEGGGTLENSGAVTWQRRA